jgi:nucleotide-binding universal stress UspA family protein
MKTLNAGIFTGRSVEIQKVLVAVDLSAHSEATAVYAAEIAKCFNASLTLAYVCEPVPLYDYASEYTFALIEDEREALGKLLDELTEKVRKLGGL